MIIQVVKFKSNLSEEELFKIVKERKSEFQKITALKQKYYFKDVMTGEYGGVYLWESKEAMQEFQQTELAKTIGAAYQISEKPKIEIYQVFMPLRD